MSINDNYYRLYIGLYMSINDNCRILAQAISGKMEDGLSLA